MQTGTRRSLNRLCSCASTASIPQRVGRVDAKSLQDRFLKRSAADWFHSQYSAEKPQKSFCSFNLMGTIYLLEYKNNIIGAYTNYNLAEIFINSCKQNNFFDSDINIISFKENTCLKIKTTLVECSYVENVNINDLQDEVKTAITELNKLTVQEKKLTESIEKHKADRKVYEIFKSKLEQDKSFVIPPEFIDKYTEFQNEIV
jgi:hypothetical protein